MQALPGAEIVSIEVHDRGYDRYLLHTRKYPRSLARLLGNGLTAAIKFGGNHKLGNLSRILARLLRAPVDQTYLGAFAQIQAIVRKRELA
jgi:hypothetical protein